MSNIAVTICLLSIVAVIGLWLGGLKVKGIGIGIGGVLFGGILVGHITNSFGIVLDGTTLHFVQEFGLILFVYTIGIQVGPAFFSSLKQSGLKLNLLALSITLFGAIIVIILYKIFDVKLEVILGIFSGAVTNTPSLGAGQQILVELGMHDITETMGTAYAMAYPFGICGILLAIYLIRFIFRVDIEQEDQDFNQKVSKNKSIIKTKNVKITNPNMHGLTLRDVPGFDAKNVIFSRLKRGETLIVPDSSDIINLGDIVHLVGDEKDILKIKLVLGEEVNDSLSTSGTNLKSVRVVVTNVNALGKKIGHLRIKTRFDVVISRLNRAGIELVPTGETSLQFGDILNLVGNKDSIESVVQIIGNVETKLQQVQMLPVFIGITLGVLFGSIPFYIPGFPVALKLGLAGGPLVVALVLARIGSIGKLYWFMPPSANLALRELGIVLFLSVVGFKAGGSFVDTLVNGDGIEWMFFGIIITFIPLISVGIIARKVYNLNYLTISGLLAGSMTDPPALAFANQIKEGSGAAALSYATVYPVVMFVRIVTPQLLAIILWSIA